MTTTPTAWKYNGIPNNADCSWPTVVSCNWWKKYPEFVCLDGRLILYDWNSGDSYGGAVVAATGWWSGYIGNGCSGSDTYAYAYSDNKIVVDVMGALNDGIWTSSVSFDLYGRTKTTSGELKVAATGWSGYPFASRSSTISVPTGSGCPVTKFGTVTVYADGNLSIT